MVSKLKIQGKLDPPGAGTFNRLAQACQRSLVRSEDRVDLQNIGVIEQIERLRNQIEAGGLAKWKVLQHTKIRRGESRCPERVSSLPERSRGERECVTAIGVEPGERVDRPAGP